MLCYKTDFSVALLHRNDSGLKGLLGGEKRTRSVRFSPPLPLIKHCCHFDYKEKSIFWFLWEKQQMERKAHFFKNL